MNVTSITGSAVGEYSIGQNDTTGSTYPIYVWIYIGGTGTFTVNVAPNSGDNYASTHTIKLCNVNNSAGNLTTLVGTLYV